MLWRAGAGGTASPKTPVSAEMSVMSVKVSLSMSGGQAFGPQDGVRADHGFGGVAPGVVVVVGVAGVAGAVGVRVRRDGGEREAARAEGVVFAGGADVHGLRFEERLQLRGRVAVEALFR